MSYIAQILQYLTSKYAAVLYVHCHAKYNVQDKIVDGENNNSRHYFMSELSLI